MDDTSPVGVLVEVFGICSPRFGCTCEYHSICGTNVYLDMVVRFKSTTVDEGKCRQRHKKISTFVSHLFSLHSFFIGGYTPICGVYWVTEGADRCLIGRVNPAFQRFFGRLNGRVGQVVTVFPCSNDPNKIAFSTKNDGVCHIMLIDRFIDGDLQLMEALDLVESGGNEYVVVD